MNKDGSNAPEVVHGNGSDGLIPAHNPAVEPLHSIRQYSSYGQPSPPGYKDGQAYSSAYGTSESAYGIQDEKLARVGASKSPSAQPRSTKRKRIIWIAIGAILFALAVALGVGLGVGLSQKGSSSESTSGGDGNSQGANQTSSTATTSTPSSSTATPSYTAVTSGTTGLAEFSCNSTQTTESSDGTPYVQECYTQYQTNHASYYSVDGNVTMKNLGGKITVYTFQDCLDKCDEWNAADEDPACRAVTYYANISAPITMWGGNCFLKNDRGNGFQTDPVDYSHTASAYQKCLNSTCYGSN